MAVLNATVATFMSPLTQYSDGSNRRVISVRTDVQGWGGGRAGASYGRRQHQRDDRQVNSVRSGCLDETHVSAVSVVLLWGETWRTSRIAVAMSAR